jgi:hypothetical protein
MSARIPANEKSFRSGNRPRWRKKACWPKAVLAFALEMPSQVIEINGALRAISGVSAIIPRSRGLRDGFLQEFRANRSEISRQDSVSEISAHR